MSSRELRERFERSLSQQDTWKIRERVEADDRGELTVTELSRTLVESWRDDVRRVCDGLDLTETDAQTLIVAADAGDTKASERIAPFNIGRVQPWQNGPESSWDEPIGEDSLHFNPDHWSCQSKQMVARIAEMYKEINAKIESEADPLDVKWLEYELEKYEEWCSNEGLRLGGDTTPWRADLSDPDFLGQLDTQQKGQLLQESIWAALVRPPSDEAGRACLKLIKRKFLSLFASGCSPTTPFVDPITGKETTALQYAGEYAHEAGRRQVALLQKSMPEESEVAGHEAGCMNIVLDAIFEFGGPLNFSSDATELARAEKKRALLAQSNSIRLPVNKLPRGYVPGYKILHTKFELLGKK